MNSSEVDALFAQTLLGDYEAEEAWDAVRALRMNGCREIFERAAAWCLADDPLKRARAADVLCQLQAERERLFSDESYALLTSMLDNEQDPVVLGSAIFGLGHLYNVMAVPLILRYLDHPVRRVRCGVSFALGCSPNDTQSIEGLLKLTSDPDDEVRDWAVFGLGVLGDADSPEIREALLRCLDDANEDVREEAAVGLGKRRDQRLIPTLGTMLAEDEINVRVAEGRRQITGPRWRKSGNEYTVTLFWRGLFR
jgi:HEAT repeat protein